MLGIQFEDDDDSNSLRERKSSSDSKSCKILLTSRSKDVLLSEMNVKDSIFSLEVIKQKELKKLFDKVARITNEDLELKSLAAKIVKKCADLPLAIVAARKALKKNQHKFAWENALQQIEMNGVLEPVEFSTKLSYEQLKTEELKSIFLLCACMGGHPSIMDLVKYCIGLGIFQGVNSIKEARDRTNTLINKLKDSSLLMNTTSYDCVTMHDMIRDAALSIASKEQNVFIQRYGKLDHWLDNNSFERYISILLHHCDFIDEIPKVMNCPRLQVFHLECKDPSLKIPTKLFDRMGELKVLILNGMDLSHFPSSIKCLQKLRMLCLEYCMLGDNMSIIGESGNLRILSLSESWFKFLLSEIRQLDKLQLFDISNCAQLKVIPSNVMSKLNRLEKLYMGNSLIQWGVEGKTFNNKIASLNELSYLQQLRSLDIHIPDIIALPRSLFFDKLENYKIVIGDSNMILLEDGEIPTKLLAKLEIIEVSQCDSLEDIVSIEGLENTRNNAKEDSIELPQLRSLTLQSLPALTCFYAHDKMVPFFNAKISLSNIESLELSSINIEKLEAFSMETASHLKGQPVLSALLKVISMLEALEMGPKEMKWLRNSIGNNVYQMQNIKKLQLRKLSNIEILFRLLDRCPNLEILDLSNSSVKECCLQVSIS
ncbi:probable disease resistance protein At4g27220 [Prosopis cineraria]|uniref:probable disease resistance protein At4g27220 n=1 Tax=Prosopis cineraria TaxID=364024 RepID=UPI00241077A1|nr:probable disease resistance protein At4g27220 [Prosopis cineraria]